MTCRLQFPYNIQVWKPEIVEPIGAHMLTDRGAALKTKKYDTVSKFC